MSTAIRYHEATKYSPETIGNHPGLDWDEQPLPYKEYDCTTPVDLAGLLPFDPNPFTGDPGPPTAAVESPLGVLSRWLFATYGITGAVAQEPRPLYLRAAPSAGGLYPAETYLVARGHGELDDGLYGYDPRHHHLVPLWAGGEVATAVDDACYGDRAVAAAPLRLIVTGVWQRSRWRYHERSYRRVLLDSGHLIGNATLAAHALGLRTHLTAAFCDDRLDAALRLDADEEGALAVVACNTPGVAERPAWSALPSGSPTTAEDADGETGRPLLDALHRAGRLPAERPRPRAQGDADAIEDRYGWRSGQHLARSAVAPFPLAADPCLAILRRRSTRRFRRGAIGREPFARVLAAAYAPESSGLGTQPSLDLGRLMTFVAVVAVEGIAPGVYYLAPHRLDLRLVKPMEGSALRESLRFLCLGQELGGDAAAVVFHAADLGAAVAAQGDRAYRYLHLDAGILGERLDLAALAEDLGASGIGGFFDDRITDLLGIPREQAVVYVTTIGIPA